MVPLSPSILGAGDNGTIGWVRLASPAPLPEPRLLRRRSLQGIRLLAQRHGSIPARAERCRGPPPAQADNLLIREGAKDGERGAKDVKRGRPCARVGHRNHNHNGALEHVGEGVREGRVHRVKHRQARVLVDEVADAVDENPAGWPPHASSAGTVAQGRWGAKLVANRLRLDEEGEAEQEAKPGEGDAVKELWLGPDAAREEPLGQDHLQRLRCRRDERREGADARKLDLGGRGESDAEHDRHHRGASRCGGRLPLDGKREQDGEQWGERLHDAREGDGGVHQAPSVRHQRDHHRGDDGGDLGVKERAGTARRGLPGRNAEAAERRGEQLLHRRDRDWERKAAQNLLG
mmetsp:Transcript_50806/g.163123  ORF Transcript_50806/g.163123 Transcript_50806/m.163123 type:complete len:348 (+) Transcript_50806:136-1179(+)